MEESTIAIYAALALLAASTCCLYGLFTAQGEFCLGGVALILLIFSYADGESDKRQRSEAGGP